MKKKVLAVCVGIVGMVLVAHGANLEVSVGVFFMLWGVNLENSFKYIRR